jgi:hypothetical protein
MVGHLPFIRVELMALHVYLLNAKLLTFRTLSNDYVVREKHMILGFPIRPGRFFSLKFLGLIKNISR